MALRINNRLTSYTFDDYLKDKEKNAGRITPASTSVAGMAGRMPTATRVGSGQIAAPSSQSAVISTPVSTPTPTPTPSTTGTGTGSEEVKNEVNSIITTDYVNTVMNEVLTGILDFANRKFEYNPKESPLYSILQEQAAKEARIASGRAYSRAVANAGGFGSSYATLAAEEASRQVMAGLDDQQLALYQAAKEEWDSQWTSMLQQYQALQSIYGTVEEQENKQKAEANAEALGMNQDTYDLLVLAGQNNWYDGRDESTLRTLITNAAAGNPNIDVEAIVNQLTGKTAETGTGTGTGTDDKPLSYAESEAAALLSSTYGTTYSPEAMRALLQSRGYTSAEIETALGVQKNLARGTVLDTVVTDLDGALTYGETLNIALSQGLLTEAEYKAAQTKNSAIILKDYEEIVANGNLVASDITRAGKLARDGIMTKGDLKSFLKLYGVENLETIKTDVGGKFNKLSECRVVLNLVSGFLDLVDDGTLSKEEVRDVIVELKDDPTMRMAYEKLIEIADSGDPIKIARLENDEGQKEAWTEMFAALSPYYVMNSQTGEYEWKDPNSR